MTNETEQERCTRECLEFEGALGEYRKAKDNLRAVVNENLYYNDAVSSAYNIEASYAAALGRLVVRHLEERAGAEKRCAE